MSGCHMSDEEQTLLPTPASFPPSPLHPTLFLCVVPPKLPTPPQQPRRALCWHSPVRTQSAESVNETVAVEKDGYDEHRG